MVRKDVELMSGQVSYNSYDYKGDSIVPVIASFDTDGHIVPLYVRINGESYRIESFWIKYAFVNQIEFNCKLIDGEYIKPLMITYHQTECVWTATV